MRLLMRPRLLSRLSGVTLNGTPPASLCRRFYYMLKQSFISLVSQFDPQRPNNSFRRIRVVDAGRATQTTHPTFFRTYADDTHARPDLGSSSLSSSSFLFPDYGLRGTAPCFKFSIFTSGPTDRVVIWIQRRLYEFRRVWRSLYEPLFYLDVTEG